MADLEEVDVEDLDEAEESIPFTYSISSYGADYPVDSLVKRMKSGDVLVPIFNKQNDDPDSKVIGFQREYVWPRPKADRFIESLLLGLPVPGIFLVKEDSGVLLVLDGHQRLFTLRSFYDGEINGEVYSLSGIQDRFNGCRYKDLDAEDRRRLDDSIIHATVVRQDQPNEDMSSVYMIFERLNTGGVNLQPQEIRVALYHGAFAMLLSDLNDDANWRELFGKKSRRLKDAELILRFFAMYFHSGNYRSPMKDFLNRYMAANRNLKKHSKRVLTPLFVETCKAILEGIGPKAFRPLRAVNAAVVDSLMFGVATRLAEGPIKHTERLAEAYERLLGNANYLGAIEKGTSQEQNVKDRLAEAKVAFARVR